MAYIGTQPLAGQYRKLDDISSGFNGATTSFTTSVGGTNVTAGSPQQLLVSLGGVIQQPTVDYTVNTSTITFTTAPASGLSFFAVLMGDALNTSVPADGSITSAKLAGSLSVGLAAGSASTPSLFFTGDTNTGIYSPGADQVAISTNGSGRLFVSSGGQIGVGTSTVGSSGNANITIAGANNSGIQFGRTNATAGGGLLTSASGPGIAFHYYTGAVGSETYTEAMRLDSSGRLGINTTSPSTTLEVSKASNNLGLTEIMRLGGTAAASNDGWKLSFFQSGSSEVGYLGSYYVSGSTWNAVLNSTHNIEFRSGNTERARIDSSGRLLVGTSTQYTVDGVGPSDFELSRAGQDSTLGVTCWRASSNGWNPNITFKRAYNDTAGNYTVVPNGAVLGIVRFAGADGSKFVNAAEIKAEVDGTAGTNDMPTRLVFSTTADGASSPTERMRIDQYGRSSIVGTIDVLYLSSTQSAGTAYRLLEARHSGTAGTPYSGTTSFQVYTNGNVQNTNNSYAGISDEKLKENIADASSQWSDLKALQVRKYNFKPETGCETHTQIGLIAQEVELVSPGLVSESPDRDAEGNDLGTVTKSVNYSVLYMKAVKALQEAMERIEQLETEMAEVKAQLA